MILLFPAWCVPCTASETLVHSTLEPHVCPSHWPSVLSQNVLTHKMLFWFWDIWNMTKNISSKTERNWSHWENVSGLCCFYPCLSTALFTWDGSRQSSQFHSFPSFFLLTQITVLCGASYLCGILKFHSCGWRVEVRCVHRSLITSGFLGWTQELLLSLTYFVVSGKSESQSWACALRILPQAWPWDRSTVEGRAGKGGRGRALLRWKPGWGAVWEQCHRPFLIPVAQHHQGRMTLEENGCCPEGSGIFLNLQRESHLALCQRQTGRAY